ncbi:MAG: ribonuclease III [Bdellovibrionales bacterium]|nr:ribonuclease III [Bdellovibrionales bacterium]
MTTEFLKNLNLQFKNEQLLIQALTHKSYHYEKGSDSQGHNERLEFLGDSVLGLGLSQILMNEYPELNEGDLSKLRASLVNESILAEMAREHGFDQHLRLGKGEAVSGGAKKPRLLACVFEAFLGALFIDSGFDTTYEFIKKMFSERVHKINPQNPSNYDHKTQLQEKSQDLHRLTPTYVVIQETGPDHEKNFLVEVQIGNKTLAQGQGRSKKQAEQEAAKKALEEWK